MEYKKLLKQNWLYIMLCLIPTVWVIFKYRTNQIRIIQNETPLAVEIENINQISGRKKEKFDGKVRNKKSVILQSQVTGIISKIKEDGAFVKKGDIIITLEHEEAEAKKNIAEARFEDEKRKLENFKKLEQEEYLTNEHYKEQQSKFKEAKGRLQETESFLNKHFIKAPFDGITGLQKQSIGAFVNQNTELISLTNKENMEVEFSISENELEKIGGIEAIKQSTFLVFFESQQKTLTATFLAYENMIDPETNGIAVRIKLQDDQNIFTNQNCKVILHYGDFEKKLAVKKDSILSSQGQDYVFIVKNGVAIKTLVELGEDLGSYIQVKGKLNENDAIVCKETYKLFDGQRVKKAEDGNEK